MALTDGSGTRLAFVLETVEGTTPASPAFQELRFKSDTLNIVRQHEVSEEIRDDRGISDVADVGGNYGGDVVGELSYGTYESQFESVLGGVWSSDSDAAGYLIDGVLTLGASALTVDTGTGDFAAGDIVTVAGDTTEYTVTAAVSGPATSIPISPVLAAVPADNAVVTLAAGPILRNGKSRTPMTLEKTYEDSEATQFFERGFGSIFGNMAFEIQEKQISQITFTVLGRGGTLGTAELSGATYTAANANPVLDASNDVSELSLTGGSLTSQPIVKAMTLSVNPNLREQAQVGSPDLAGIGLGRLEPTGQITLYFENNEAKQTALDQDDLVLSFLVGRADTERYRFTIPRLRIMNPRSDTQGISTDVLVVADWTGIVDATEGASIKIERYASETP